MQRILIVLACLMATGCSTWITPLKPPGSLAAPCPPIAKPMAGDDLYEFTIGLIGQYNDCAARQAALAKAAR